MRYGGRIERLLPQVDGRGRPWRDHRQVVNGVLWRLRTGAPWRDLPERHGPWQTVYEWVARRDAVLAALLRTAVPDVRSCGFGSWNGRGVRSVLLRDRPQQSCAPAGRRVGSISIELTMNVSRNPMSSGDGGRLYL